MRIDSCNPNEKLPILLSLLQQTNAAGVWCKDKNYFLKYNGQELNIALSNTIIKRESKKGDFRYEIVNTEPVGQGTYGTVFTILSTCKINGDYFTPKDQPYGKRRIVKVFSPRQPWQQGQEMYKNALTEYDFNIKTNHLHPKKPIQNDKDTYCVTRLMEGKDLFDVILDDYSTLDCNDNCIPLKKRFEYTYGLLTALKEQVVEKKLVHRDIKPENIMIDIHTGAINIIDYGFAKQAGMNCRNEQLGTLGYISPEGLEFNRTDSRSDIYSLGRVVALLWHLSDIKSYHMEKEEMTTQKALFLIKTSDYSSLFHGLLKLNTEAKNKIMETITKLTAVEPNNRISIDEAIRGFKQAEKLQFKEAFVDQEDSKSPLESKKDNQPKSIFASKQFAPYCAAFFIPKNYSDDNKESQKKRTAYGC